MTPVTFDIDRAPHDQSPEYLTFHEEIDGTIDASFTYAPSRSSSLLAHVIAQDILDHFTVTPKSDPHTGIHIDNANNANNAKVTCTCGHLLYIIPLGHTLDWTSDLTEATPEQLGIMALHRSHQNPHVPLVAVATWLLTKPRTTP